MGIPAIDVHASTDVFCNRRIFDLHLATGMIDAPAIAISFNHAAALPYGVPFNTPSGHGECTGIIYPAAIAVTVPSYLIAFNAAGLHNKVTTIVHSAAIVACIYIIANNPIGHGETGRCHHIYSAAIVCTCILTHSAAVHDKLTGCIHAAAILFSAVSLNCTAFHLENSPLIDIHTTAIGIRSIYNTAALQNKSCTFVYLDTAFRFIALCADSAAFSRRSDYHSGSLSADMDPFISLICGIYGLTVQIQSKRFSGKCDPLDFHIR